MNFGPPFVERLGSGNTGLIFRHCSSVNSFMVPPSAISPYPGATSKMAKIKSKLSLPHPKLSYETASTHYAIDARDVMGRKT
jgi:hypothetical protein